MTDWVEGQDSGGMKELRKLVKDQGKKLKELEAERSQWQARNRTADIHQALADRGLNPKVAKFYPSDSGTDDESVDKWLAEKVELVADRRVIDNGNLNDSVLTDSEQRGYQIINDISAYETSVQMDLKSRLDKINYDPQNPDAAQKELFSVLQEFEGHISQ